MCGVGLCPVLLEMLRTQALALKDHEKRITLSFDGMTLKQSIMYKKHSDELCGFVDCGKYSQTAAVADKSILLMVHGLTLKWKQMIGFFITKHNLSAIVLSQIISDTVIALKNISFMVDYIVMDQESSQWKWVDIMGVSPEKPWVEHSDVRSFVIPDPHLIKNLRNNFMTKDIEFTLNGVHMTAKWLHVKTLYTVDSQKPIQAVHRWTDYHFTLSRGKRMKVILACQIFSHSAAVAMKLHVAEKLLPTEATQTAHFLETVNSMWDFIDSRALGAPPGKKTCDIKGHRVRFYQV